MTHVILKTAKLPPYQRGAMETETISKNGANLKSHMSRGNILARRILPFLFATLIIGVCDVNAGLFDTRFNCKKDVLDQSNVRISPDPSTLTVGQQCKIEIFNTKGKSVSEKDFTVSSNNRYVRSHVLSFHIANDAKGSPWDYLDGKLVEIDGTITVAHKECYHKYDFPFQVRQSYVFDNVAITCKGERREFAIARYENMLGKDLFVVRDITRNQLYLVEAPISIDASGVKGRDGASGNAGKNGVSGTQNSRNGGDGGSGSDGGDGGPGGDGGEITIYLANHIQGIPINVNVAGGEGGRGGKGGKGGSGGEGYKVKVGEKKGAFGLKVPVYEKLGSDGRSGTDGRSGAEGRRGRDGYLKQIPEDNIKKYFENISQKNFNLKDVY